MLFRGFRFLLTLSLLSCLALSAQTTGANADATDLRHRIEKNVRAHFKVPNRVQIEVSQPRPSELNGYDAVTVTLISGEKLVVRETLEEICSRIVTFRRSVLQGLTLGWDPSPSQRPIPRLAEGSWREPER